ncbi:MAG TPA: S46 family peptidase [Bacteroidales bacterium]|nr:S46 family peptidase [Bacteroidales bacterium]
MKSIRGRAILSAAFILLCFHNLQAQEIKCDKQVEPGLYDMGKMWTFDYPPAEYFSSTYNFKPDQKWFDQARLSALRFADYCSASFVSADGLVMTNHHCARESGFAVQRKGENVNENGFYAKKLADERKVPDLYVDQLVKIEDITDRVLKAMEGVTADTARLIASARELAMIKKEYKSKEDWKDLELETIQFYSGGKFSLYGFKRYKDVRLVFMPETQMAYFGGDYDNFTYPRYDLDCSFFRVYDDNGKPLKTDHYFKYNSDGANEGDAVFVIGNPGSTMRMSTISDLEFYRDKQLPFITELLDKLSQMYQKYNETAKDDSITNLVFSLDNSLKVYKGELDGLKDPCILARKAGFEKKFREDAATKRDLAADTGVWNNIANANDERRKIYDEMNLLSISGRFFTGQLMQYAVGAVILSSARQDTAVRGKIIRALDELGSPKDMGLEQQMLAIYLETANDRLGADHPFVRTALNGKSPEEAAAAIMSGTKLKDRQFRESLAKMDSAEIARVDDPLIKLARVAVARDEQISDTYDAILARLFTYHSKLGRMLFETYGTRIPPDATFSLRINDGIVKGYEYNGTIAPPNTTFFGLYDRYYSFDEKFPYSLPKRWENPSEKLLKAPLDFVTTNDVIGGNSGSPMVNKDLEIVGLVFDGNIESLPGAYIFIPEENRTIAVHSGGIIAGLRYIYKASRLINELEGHR